MIPLTRLKPNGSSRCFVPAVLFAQLGYKPQGWHCTALPPPIMPLADVPAAGRNRFMMNSISLPAVPAMLRSRSYRRPGVLRQERPRRLSGLVSPLGEGLPRLAIVGLGSTAPGGRSALASKTLKDVGYEKVFNPGAFKDWADGGGATDL
jgi:hypothetical protein